jgi:hypothetical protein
MPIASNMTSVRDRSILIAGQRRGKYNRQTLVSADEANRRSGKEFRLNREPLRSDNTKSRSLLIRTRPFCASPRNVCDPYSHSFDRTHRLVVPDRFGLSVVWRAWS